jgi:hypothetical protein
MIKWFVELDFNEAASPASYGEDLYLQYRTSFVKPVSICISKFGIGQVLYDYLKAAYPSLPVIS